MATRVCEDRQDLLSGFAGPRAHLREQLGGRPSRGRFSYDANLDREIAEPRADRVARILRASLLPWLRRNGAGQVAILVCRHVAELGGRGSCERKEWRVRRERRLGGPVSVLFG